MIKTQYLLLFSKFKSYSCLQTGLPPFGHYEQFAAPAQIDEYAYNVPEVSCIPIHTFTEPGQYRSVRIMKRAHGNYVSHKCSLCGKIIKGQKYILKQHIDTVHKKKVKKFECDLCPFETHINMTLTKHKEALHLPKK